MVKMENGALIKKYEEELFAIIEKNKLWIELNKKAKEIQVAENKKPTKAEYQELRNFMLKHVIDNDLEVAAAANKLNEVKRGSNKMDKREELKMDKKEELKMGDCYLKLVFKDGKPGGGYDGTLPELITLMAFALMEISVTSKTPISKIMRTLNNVTKELQKEGGGEIGF